MSSLMKRKDSPYWFVAFDVPQPDGTTRRLKKSTKKKNKDEALVEVPRIIEAERKMAMADDEENRANFEILAEANRAAARGELSEARARDLLSRMLKGSVGHGFENYTTRSWAEEWQKRKRPLEKATRRRYDTSVRAFLSFLGERKDKRLDQISKADIRRFRDVIYYGKESLSLKTGKNVEELEAIRSAVTANHYVADIKGVLAEAVEDGVLSINPAAGLKPLPENDAMKRKPFTYDEVKLLVEKAGEEGWYGLIFSQKAKTPRLRLLRCSDWPGMILFGYYIGARISDIARLTWGNIDLTNGIVTYVPGKTKNRKSSSICVVPLHPFLLTWLKRRSSKAKEPESVEPIFPNLFCTSTSGNCGLSSQFGAIMDFAEVDRMLVRPNSKGRRKLHARGFHSLRHTNNSSLANADVSQEVRMEMIGHSSQEVNKVYTHHELEKMRSAVNKLPSL